MGAVQDRFEIPGCQFEVQVESELPKLIADVDASGTTLINLLDNAYKYTGDEKRIQLRAYAADGNVCFEVKDNGIGISPRESKKIFRRFYQVDQSLSRSAGGCGLGLSIVQFIVTAHKGSVHVDSQPGQGSTFTIGLPAANENSE